MNEELHDMLIDQLRDAHSAEKQAVQLMKRVLRKTTHPQLREGIEAHIQQSESQRERVEQCLEQLGGRVGRKVCEAMRGLAEEAQHEMDEHDKGPLLDVIVVAAQQRIEHYEIASYGTMAELAKAMGHEQEGQVLGEILQEEKQQDERLTQLTREMLLPELMEGEEMEEDEEEEGGEEEEGAPPRRTASRGTTRKR